MSVGINRWPSISKSNLVIKRICNLIFGMSEKFNESGEIIREGNTQEACDEYLPATLTDMWEGLMTQSMLPPSIEQPADVLYWAPRRAEFNKGVFQRFQQLA